MVRTKKMPQTLDPENIYGRALLVDLDTSMWEARVTDKDVTRKANERWANDQDAGSYIKRLFGAKTPEMSAVITAREQLRRTVAIHTMPWEDGAWRLLPTANFLAFREATDKAITRFTDAVDALLVAYERLVQEAEVKLGSMFRRNDYPAVEVLRSKFSVSIRRQPLPTHGDIRIDLPQEELARVEADVKERYATAMKAAVAEAWTRLGDMLTEMREKMTDGKYLRDGMLDRFRGVCEALGRLNITNNADLDAARTQVLKTLGGHSAATLKADEQSRNQVAKDVDAILKRMQAVYSPTRSDG